MTAVLVFLGLAALVILYVIGLYNGLVRLKNQVKNAWAQIDVQLHRRHDLIPNLVNTVKGYAAHERETLEKVVQARNMAVQAKGAAAQSQAEQELTGALGRLLVVVEQYPDLKANQNFLQLQEELTSTENKISFSRQYYNDSVLQYNTRIQVFPANVIAGMYHFTEEEYFELEDKTMREAPKVAF